MLAIGVRIFVIEEVQSYGKICYETVVTYNFKVWSSVETNSVVRVRVREVWGEVGKGEGSEEMWEVC